ncbi:hypothetical protein [Actinoplanes sp. HUAS TT8]|uniref:hypothetical protein n=1 Tax=Actinoplanes sp. HUAS TT8 TaxID=3447453 RepID=UPI003F524AFD
MTDIDESGIENVRNLRRNTVIAALLGLVAVLLPAPAMADKGTVDQVSRTASLNIYPPAAGASATYTNVITVALDLVAGEHRHLRGRLETVSSTTGVVAFNAAIWCTPSTDLTDEIGNRAVSSRNHEGSDASYAETGHLPLLVDKLFTAPYTGRFICSLNGLTASSSITGYHLGVVTGGKTYLQTSSDNQVGAGAWESLPCASQGNSQAGSQCTFLGTGGKSDVFVFYNDGSTVKKWAYGPGVTKVQAYANVLVTTCYKSTASCDGVPESDRLARTANSYSAVQFRLDVIQLGTDNSHACYTPPATTVTNNVRDDAHHFTAFMNTTVDVDPNCGQYFIMRVYVKLLSGSPIKIDGVQNTSSLTNGIMLNL